MYIIIYGKRNEIINAISFRKIDYYITSSPATCSTRKLLYIMNFDVLF